ncbi:uncharacterized protein LOC143610743 [Bidens hawaiensis]|uniref:uncharacterized protein LOC143610743 n=1 Tax=Bidens hawaiensis TaxID=980011 RepID=UPI00404A7012
MLEEKRKNMEEEFGTGSGLNQELSLSRAGDTRWSSHYKTLDRLVTLYPSVMEVLEYIEQIAKTIGHSNQADKLQADMKKYDFVFYLHLMRRILDTTNILSRSLQKKEQDLVNAISLIKSTKRQLESLRLHGFNSFIEEVNYFCEKHELEIVNLKDPYINPKKPRQKTNITLHHYYEYDCFNTVLDMQIQEFENRFSEETSELLTCISSLSPCDGFRGFHIPKLLRLADMYPYDFDEKDKDRIRTELEVYIDNLKEDTRLLKLALVLPVATATVERCFSAMKYIKSDLRNRMGDEHLSDSCICFVEKDLLRIVSIDDVMDRKKILATPLSVLVVEGDEGMEMEVGVVVLDSDEMEIEVFGVWQPLAIYELLQVDMEKNTRFRQNRSKQQTTESYFNIEIASNATWLKRLCHNLNEALLEEIEATRARFASRST